MMNVLDYARIDKGSNEKTPLHTPLPPLPECILREKRNVAHRQHGNCIEKQFIETNELQQIDDAPNPLFKLFRKKQKDNRRITAALLAFPFPFGIVGLHRIFLGTKPYVPVAYIASLGGIFGLMPLIDFFVICFDKDFEQYLNNPKVLMWVK
ncbi:MAG: TM2 domain-containing protein [Sphingobacteriaceae bacterium]|nr:TM2 domain-containing protein [Sphingobacteriaceae bacterium]